MSATIRAAAAWTSALLVAAALLGAGGYISRDPDSRVYSEISAQAATRPLTSWVAPRWWGVAGADEPFREHPFGIFVLPAMLVRLGFPALQAGYTVGALFSMLAVICAGLVAATVVGHRERAFIQWTMIVLPVAFVYRIRANQEYPVLVFVLLAVYATERARRSPGWTPVPALATVAVLLIKDVFFVFAPIACALWLLCVPDPAGCSRRAWGSVALSCAAAVAGTAIFEFVYRWITGDSFLVFFVRHRLTPNSGLDRATGIGPAAVARVSNLVWYMARLAWFSFPWSVVLLWTQVRPIPPAADTVEARRARGALVGCLLFAAAHVALMSLGGNRADRFIFLAYFAVAAAGAAAAVHRWRPLQRAADRVALLGAPATAALWMVLFVVTLATSHQLPRLKFWP